jgi:predicted nucleic acid-binding protein
MEEMTGTASKVYIETSVWGMILPDQPRALRVPTKRFLDQCEAGLFFPFISPVVLREVRRAKPREAERMLDEIHRLEPTVLLATEKSKHLADDYITAGVISAKKRDDALHVAIASSEGLDLLVTWNHRHLASDLKKELFNAVNQLAGRDRKLLIHTPFEALR